jgi:hypothetical protein
MDTSEDLQQAERQAFGGFDKGAAFFGWLVATAVGSLLTALLSAAGIAAALNNNAPLTAGQLRTAGWIAALLWLISLGIAYYAGGYVAGRMARYDGGRQGFGVWAISIAVIILLAIAGAIFGSNFNLLGQLNLPHIPLSQDGLTLGGIVTLILALAVSLLTAIWGAKLGERYHRKIDEFSATTRPAEPAPSAPVERPTRMQPTFGERIDHRDRDADHS